MTRELCVFFILYKHHKANVLSTLTFQAIVKRNERQQWSGGEVKKNENGNDTSWLFWSRKLSSFLPSLFFPFHLQEIYT